MYQAFSGLRVSVFGEYPSMCGAGLGPGWGSAGSSNGGFHPASHMTRSRHTTQLSDSVPRPELGTVILWGSGETKQHRPKDSAAGTPTYKPAFSCPWPPGSPPHPCPSAQTSRCASHKPSGEAPPGPGLCP